MGHEGVNELRERGELTVSSISRQQQAGSRCGHREVWGERQQSAMPALVAPVSLGWQVGCSEEAEPASRPPVEHAGHLSRAFIRENRHGETAKRLGRCLGPKKNGLCFMLFVFLLQCRE